MKRIFVCTLVALCLVVAIPVSAGTVSEESWSPVDWWSAVVDWVVRVVGLSTEEPVEEPAPAPTPTSLDPGGTIQQQSVEGGQGEGGGDFDPAG